MEFAFVAMSALLPLMMFYIQNHWPKMRLLFNTGALLSLLVFGNIASLSIYQIIQEKTVFMTTIHGLFLNPAFLITGAYTGVYILYRGLLIGVDES
ncbi:transposase [Virgibacillus halophilus]|uniref:Transposase n=2 Tax=Tigheibacillus halophilus TaxID=361280 RepID=A0ABU5C9A6_9BACI|nr:transposase [Virgibacillus halophilus]